MSDNNRTIPVILIDFKKDRIRIHKNTFFAIGNPDYVLLLVNPVEQTLAILRSDHSDLRAHHITKTHDNIKPFELYSRSLTKNLRDLCGTWHQNQSYRLYGEIIPNKGVVEFHISKAVPLNRLQV